MTVHGHLAPGIVCSLVTPFRSDEAVDLHAFGELIDFQIGAGVHGLFLLGTAGEGILLDADERRRAAEFAVDRIAGRVPLALHCGAADTKTAAHLAEHASRSGADAIAVVSPYYFAYGDEALRTHFAAVANAATPLPVYLYDNPERVGYSLAFSMVHDLVREIDNIKGIKDTGDSIARVTHYVTMQEPEVEVYTGNNMIVLPALVMGAKGSVSALASAFPELFVAIYEKWQKGDQQEARRLQLVAARLQGILNALPYVGGIKYLVARRGLPSGGMRRPLPGIGEFGGAIEERLKALGDVFEYWTESLG